MSDITPYEADILTWSESQAALLLRLQAGEKVNAEIDWENVIEEVLCVGRSELKSCASLLVQIYTHLLKIALATPDSTTASHWEDEIVAFVGNLARDYTPSMDRRLTLNNLWLEARKRALKQEKYTPIPCPFSMQEMLDLERGDIARLADRAKNAI